METAELQVTPPSVEWDVLSAPPPMLKSLKVDRTCRRRGWRGCYPARPSCGRRYCWLLAQPPAVQVMPSGEVQAPMPNPPQPLAIQVPIHLPCMAS